MAKSVKKSTCQDLKAPKGKGPSLTSLSIEAQSSLGWLCASTIPPFTWCIERNEDVMHPFKLLPSIVFTIRERPHVPKVQILFQKSPLWKEKKWSQQFLKPRRETRVARKHKLWNYTVRKAEPLIISCLYVQTLQVIVL